MNAVAEFDLVDDIRPEDFTVDVVVKPMGGFAPVNTQGVRVTHKPTGISVTCDEARSQHTNRHQAFETLRTILALRPAAVPMTDEEAKELIKKSDLLDMFLHIGWYSAPRKNFDTHALALIRAVESRYAGITAQAKKEGA